MTGERGNCSLPERKPQGACSSLLRACKAPPERGLDVRLLAAKRVLQTQLRRRAIARGEKAPHHKDNEGAYDGANEPRAFARLIPADRLPDVYGGERTDNPQNGGQDKSRRFIRARVQKLGDNTRNEPDNDSPKDANNFLLSDHE